MGTPRRRRETVRVLRLAGWMALRDRGGHEIWGCLCGSHSTALPHHREISAGVVTSILKQMEACA